MPLASKVAAAFAVFSALGLVASVPIVGQYSSRAVLTQRVEVDKASADLFGDQGSNKLIGSPQMLIIDDEKAILPTKEVKGLRQVDESYLVAHKIYPLQLTTVNFVATLARIGLFVVFVVSIFAMSIANKLNTRKMSA